MSPLPVYHGHRLRRGRHSEPGRVYLVTTVTHERTPVFAHWDSGWACARALHEVAADLPVTSLAWVVMPDHVHWLLALDRETLGRVMQRFKSRSARHVNARSGRRGRLWQAGFHDHAVRREEEIRDLARYVVANPLRAGLCSRAGDYPFWDAIWLTGESPVIEDP